MKKNKTEKREVEYEICKEKIRVSTILIFTVCGLSFISTAIVFFKSQYFPAIIFIVIYHLILFILLFGLRNKKDRKTGYASEIKIKNILGQIAKSEGGYVIRDVMIPTRDNKTTQIDCVYLSTKGIFVVEVKSYHGMIFGKYFDEKWTQVLGYGNVKNRFYNPVKQNEGHIYNLNNLVENELEMENVIVFDAGDTTNVLANEVVSTSNFETFIRLKMTGDKFDKNTIHNLYQKLVEYKMNPIASKRKHIKNIREKYK